MTGGDITCIESMEGAEVFGEKINVLKLAVLKKMSQPFDGQLYMYKLAIVRTVHVVDLVSNKSNTRKGF